MTLLVAEKRHSCDSVTTMYKTCKQGAARIKNDVLEQAYVPYRL